MSTARLVTVVVLVGLAVGLVATGFAAGGDAGASASRAPDPGPADTTVVLDVEHSKFVPERVEVEAGTTVRFVVDNGDPIAHELIVGPPEVHERHERGTHAFHAPIPGEVSVDALASAETTYRFDEPGEVLFACHLPGHFAYGMRGEVVVRPAA